MPNYHYTAVDQNGRAITGELFALSREDALAQLSQAQGLEVQSLEELKSDAAEPAQPSLSQKQSEYLASQIAELASSSLPLEEGLRRLGDEQESMSAFGHSRLKTLLYQLANKLEGGVSLDKVLEELGGAEDLIAAIRVGTKTGNASSAIAQYVTYVRSLSHLRARLSLAFFYPAVLFSMAVIIILLFLRVIAPQMSQLFAGFQFNVELPLITLVMIRTAEFTEQYLPTVMIITPLLVVGLILFWRFGPPRYVRTIQLSIPVFGSILHALLLARFSHCLAFLMENMVPMYESIQVAGMSSGDPLLREATDKWSERLEQGDSPMDAAEGLRHIPRELVPTLQSTRDVS
ncbi:MAG: type II secretion system F family protein [Planctomycetaceae bacterium]|nr:type II secretion system F family protein [Planctomycetaceae bacterium]